MNSKSLGAVIRIWCESKSQSMTRICDSFAFRITSIRRIRFDFYCGASMKFCTKRTNTELAPMTTSVRHAQPNE